MISGEDTYGMSFDFGEGGGMGALMFCGVMWCNVAVSWWWCHGGGVSFPSIDAILEGDGDWESKGQQDDDDGVSVACSTLSTLSSAEGSQKGSEKEEGHVVDEGKIAAETDGNEGAISDPPQSTVPSSPTKRSKLQVAKSEAFPHTTPKASLLSTLKEKKQVTPPERSLRVRADDGRHRNGEGNKNGEVRMDEDEDVEMRTWAETPKKGASAAAPAAASAAHFDFMGHDAPKIRRACAYCHQKKGKSW